MSVVEDDLTSGRKPQGDTSDWFLGMTWIGQIAMSKGYDQSNLSNFPQLAVFEDYLFPMFGKWS